MKKVLNQPLIILSVIPIVLESCRNKIHSAAFSSSISKCFFDTNGICDPSVNSFMAQACHGLSQAMNQPQVLSVFCMMEVSLFLWTPDAMSK